jgi:voltage-gated potassium channel Kch
MSGQAEQPLGRRSVRAQPAGANLSRDQAAIRLMHLQAQVAGRFEAPRSPWWRRWSWLFLTVLALTALGLALGGGHGSLSRVEDALSLFPSGFPDHKATIGKSTAFIVAEYLAPVVALWVTGSVVVALYARRSTELRARLRRGHVVVCGLGEKGLRSARAFRHQGAKVTCIELDGSSDAANDMRARGAIVLEGDASQGRLLKMARVDRAANVVCACYEDSANASIAAQVEQLARMGGKGPVNVFVHIANPDLSGILRAPTFAVEPVRLHFFNIYDLWAQALVEEAHLDELVADEGLRPNIIVLGSTGLARSLVVWAVRRWYRLCFEAKGQPGITRQLRITLVAGDAGAQCASLIRRYPALGRTAELVPVDHAVASSNPIDPGSLVGAEADERATVYLCLFDDAENLSFALQARRRLRADSRVIIPATAWTAELAPLLLGTSSGIHAVGYSDDPDSLDVLRDSTREVMAREVHANFLASVRARPEADVPWEKLSEGLRESNRQQVDAMDNNLRALWYEIEPLFDWDEPLVELSAADIEMLAELEHLRWYEEKRRLGYRYGPVKDDAEKTHPDFVSYGLLSKEAQEKDRIAVRAWPKILARAGYALERSPRREQLAELIHEQHREDRTAAGDSAAVNPLLVPWQQLSEEQRELSRASADDIGIKLARIGCRLVPDWANAPPFSFTQSELDLLAELEHERWSQQRLSTGWRHGPERDDAAKVHPDLVPWSKLPEDRRRIDRDHVRAIPELVAGIGLQVVRCDLDEARQRTVRVLRKHPPGFRLSKRGLKGKGTNCG